jgi:amino acid transporter/nucleotide-binding universal stress UspA family protein
MSAVIVGQKRPRDLAWFHAGPLLFGDWGTSRLYVLGLAFYYTAHASPMYLLAMAGLMSAVAWAYSVICRCFPEGGGVYAAARQLSPTLSVVGATLLICDYIVTAALSAVEGFHYFGVPGAWVVLLSVLTIAGIGVINWLGAKSAGRFALIIAIAAIILSLAIALMCLPMAIEGFRSITGGHASVSSPLDRWENLVRVVLALSGLEAVANMTGLMKQPVAKTSRRTIFPVLIEVITLNMIFGLALNALPELKPVDKPHYVLYEVEQRLAPENVPAEVKEYRDTAMRQLSEHVVEHHTASPAAGRVAGVVSGVIFGLLLISAVNTAVMAMVSVKYAMSVDGELPPALRKLNYSGVPWVGLVVACVLPAGLLLISADAKFLSELYAIGVVGAIAINVLSCAVNASLPIGRWERRGMWVLGVFMSLVFITIVVVKPNAAIFAGVMVGGVLAARFVYQQRRLAAEARALPEPELGWLAELEREPVQLDPAKPRIMLAARGRYQAEFAIDMARRRGATLFAIYVRTLRVLDMGPGKMPRIQDDAGAQESLGTVALLARQYGVPCIPIYVCSPDIPEEILDYTVTYGCDTLIMGKTRRSPFARRVEGDVVSLVAQHLPDGVALITRDATPHPIGPPPAAAG